MSKGLIFITGATGFIGSATAVEALKTGYRLRVCHRKPPDQLQILLSDYTDRVEFVSISDLTNEIEFSGKLDGVDHVLHLASPLPHTTDKDAYFDPAVKGTLALLRAAAKVPSIKKFVITWSIAALIPLSGIPDGGIIKEDNDWDFSVDEKTDFEDLGNPTAVRMRLYQASKLLANNATWHFRATAKPQYAIVTLHPAFVYGHNLVQTTADGVQRSSNRSLWNFIMGGDSTGLMAGVHIHNVAEAHIKALDPKIVDGSKYLLASSKTSGSEIVRIVQSVYRDCGAKITEDAQCMFLPVDTTKAETELGIKWCSFETMVRDVMDQQLGFRRDA